MLQCVYPTHAKKLGFIAATYRTGQTETYQSCPNTCPLLPAHAQGVPQIDPHYLQLELNAVPKNGLAWAYTHFNPQEIFKHHATTLNISTDTLEDALSSVSEGFPTVYAAPYTDQRWPRHIHSTPFIRCPAETSNTTCQTCGGGRPLCARPKRRYVIVFVAHGAKKRNVGITQHHGGCYASTGPVHWVWDRTIAHPNRISEYDDPDRFKAWIASLPSGTLLRHRIAGDIGLDPTTEIKP